MPRNDFSPGGRTDPAKSKPLANRYESKAAALFRQYAREARETALDSVTKAVLSGPAGDMKSALKSLASSYGGDIEKLAASVTESNYKAGVKFGAGYLGKRGIKAPTTLLPADWRALDILETRNLSVLEGITTEINETIIREVTAGMTEGESIREISDRLGDLEGIAEDRAYRIARYETMFAINQGALLRYYQTGVRRVEWVTGGDDGHTCDDCLDLDGQIFDIEDAPECPYHVNCRCTYAPVVEEEREYVFGNFAAKHQQQGGILAFQARIRSPPLYLNGPGCKCPCCEAMEV